MKVHSVLSSFGFWGEGLVAPVEEFDATGAEHDLATPYGHPPAVVDVNIYPSDVDRPVNVQPMSPEIADKVREVVESDRLSQVRAVSEAPINDFDTLRLVSGSGSIRDTNNCQALHEPIRRCYVADKLVACERYSVGVVPFNRHPDSGRPRSIFWGRRVAGRPIRVGYTTPYRDEEISVVMDAPFLTIRPVSESRECGRAIVAHLGSLQHA